MTLGKTFLPLLTAALLSLQVLPSEACTGITLKTAAGNSIVARTIEWGGSNLNSRYVVVPRGHAQTSYLPDGKKEGMTFLARYGYVGLAVEQDEFVAEGLNEAGLSAGLFYFPGYGQYAPYDPAQKSKSIADLQLVSWILGECETVDEVKKAVNRVRVVAIDPRASTVHWRFTDAGGHQVVLEIIGGKVQFYDSPLGVLTNSPDFAWQMTHLNNYVNLAPAQARPTNWATLRSRRSARAAVCSDCRATSPPRRDLYGPLFTRPPLRYNRIPSRRCASVSRYSIISTFPSV